VGGYVSVWLHKGYSNGFKNVFYRTILSEMVSSVCLYCVAYNLVAFCPDMIRYTYGPTESICWIELVAKNTIIFALELCVDIHITFKVKVHV
jgi:hypothetical protein